VLGISLLYSVKLGKALLFTQSILEEEEG